MDFSSALVRYDHESARTDTPTSSAELHLCFFVLIRLDSIQPSQKVLFPNIFSWNNIMQRLTLNNDVLSASTAGRKPLKIDSGRFLNFGPCSGQRHLKSRNETGGSIEFFSRHASFGTAISPGAPTVQRLQPPACETQLGDASRSLAWFLVTLTTNWSDKCSSP